MSKQLKALFKNASPKKRHDMTNLLALNKTRKQDSIFTLHWKYKSVLNRHISRHIVASASDWPEWAVDPLIGWCVCNARVQLRTFNLRAQSVPIASADWLAWPMNRRLRQTTRYCTCNSPIGSRIRRNYRVILVYPKMNVQMTTCF